MPGYSFPFLPESTSCKYRTGLSRAAQHRFTRWVTGAYAGAKTRSPRQLLRTRKTLPNLSRTPAGHEVTEATFASTELSSLGTSSGHGHVGAEAPDLTFGIATRVTTTAIVLVDPRHQDARAGRDGPVVVCVDIRDDDVDVA